MFELEGNVCSLIDSTAEEYVLVLVEYVVDEVRDRISRFFLGSKVVFFDGAGVFFVRMVV